MDARPREPQTKRDSRARSQSPLVVAIDGPSGSGKSSVSRAAARGLNAAYLDTGAMYRALTWWLLERGIDLADADAVAQAAPGCPIRMGMDPLAPTVAVGEVDVGAAIRTERVTCRVSQVAIVPAVRGAHVPLATRTDRRGDEPGGCCGCGGARCDDSCRAGRRCPDPPDRK